MKKLLITLGLLFVGTMSFVSAGFLEDKSISFTCAPNYCSPGSFSFGNGINSLSITSEKGGTLNCTLYCSNGSTVVYDDFSSQFLYFSNAGQTKSVSCPGSKIVSISLANSDIGGTYAGSYQIETSKIPVSEFNPVINGLESVVNEFIPYVVYIGIGLISAIIGFVAVRRLINRVRGKSLGVFRSKKK